MQVVLATATAKAATADILAMHCIASDRSPDLLKAVAGGAAVAAGAVAANGAGGKGGGSSAGGSGRGGRRR